jgi:hypothetical protein
MTFKKTTFNESEVMRGYARIALDQKIITLEPVKKTASEVISLKPTGSLANNIIMLCNALKASGHVKEAKELEQKFVIYKAAETDLYKSTDETGEDLLDAAHPEGSPEVADDKESVVENTVDVHDAVMKMLEQKPMGKHAKSKKTSYHEKLKAKFLHLCAAVEVLLYAPFEAMKPGKNAYVDWTIGGESNSFFNDSEYEKLRGLFAKQSETIGQAPQLLNSYKDRFVNDIDDLSESSMSEMNAIINSILKDVIGVWYKAMLTPYLDIQNIYQSKTVISKNLSAAALANDWFQKMKYNQHQFEVLRSEIHPEVNESVPESLKEIEPSLDVKDFISLSIDIKKDLYEFFSNPEFKKTKDVIGKAITDIKQLEKAFSDIAVASKSAEFYVPGKIKIDSLPDFIKQYASTTLVPMASARGFSVDSVKDVNSYKQFLLEAWDGIRDMNYD